MSCNKQRRLPKTVRPKMGGDVISDVNQGMQVLTGDSCSHITAPSYRPRPAMPHIGDGRLTFTTVDPPKKHQPKVRGQAAVPTQLPAAAQQLANKRPPKTRSGFTHQPGCDKGKKDRASPVLLNLQENHRQKSSRPRDKVVVEPTTDHLSTNINIKLPEMPRASQANKRVRPKSGDAQQPKGQLSALPPIPARGSVVMNQNFQKEMDAPLEEAPRVERPTKAELKKKKRV